MAIDVIQLECKENKTRNPSSLLGLVPRASASGRGSGSRHSQTIADTEPSRIRSRSVVVVFVDGGFNVVSSASTSVKYSQNCNNFGSGFSNSLLAKFRRQQERYVCSDQGYVPHVGRQWLEISI
ncbi:GM25398 [Drosophila sechellia]|uniref:GM25398 n=1 Tax=Drosophila sechellia TaxID=7238 RepID=B4HGP7_DROSE|nr:GM25398 [Drosophila sechellia]